MVRELLSIVMDGINDTNMLLDYYEETDDPEMVNFYFNHAKKRYDEIIADFSFVKSHIGLEQKVREGDAIAEALHGHLQHEIMRIKNRMNMS